MGKHVASLHFQDFSPFLSSSWHVFHLKSGQINHLKNVDVYTFWGGGVCESVFCTLIYMLIIMDGPLISTYVHGFVYKTYASLSTF